MNRKDRKSLLISIFILLFIIALLLTLLILKLLNGKWILVLIAVLVIFLNRTGKLIDIESYYNKVMKELDLTEEEKEPEEEEDD